MFQALIERMDRWLAANRPDYDALLQPGATEAELETFAAQFAIKLPAAFRSLYQWRSGQDAGSSLPFQGNRTFLTLEEIRSTKAELDSMIGYDFDDPAYWRRGWVPFLHNGASRYLCLDVTAEEGGHPGQIVAFWKRDSDRPVTHPNIEAWLADLVASMEAGQLKLA